MKTKSLIIGLLLSAVCCLNTAAQSSSTEANPKWYYIQVKGLGLTANRVLTEVDGQVLGQPLNTSHIDSISKQLWRFEIPSGTTAYRIINKYSQKQLTVVFDAVNNLRRPALTDNSTTIWSFTSAITGYKYMRIVNEPEEGVQGDIYLSQTFNQGYACKLVSLANRTTDNEYFRCVLNEIPVASTGDATVWMNIRNPKTNKYLTDAVSSAPGTNFTLESQSNSQAQQWKITAKENGNVEFVNRATGNLISTATRLDKYYYVDYAADPAGNTGWKYALASGGDGQYEVYSTGDDSVISYWNATTNGQAPDVYSAGSTANSTYAWIFSWVEETRTGIHSPVVWDNIRVYSKDKRIYVEGCDEYRIITVSGMPVRKNIELPLGIYLVTVKGKTTKILVK
jgi:hypothetical protein